MIEKSFILHTSLRHCLYELTAKGPIRLVFQNSRGTLSYEELLNLATEPQIDKVRKLQSSIDPDQLCHLQFTSVSRFWVIGANLQVQFQQGTTGQPKAPMQSHFQIVNNSYFIGKRHELDRKHHSICIMVPFFHGMGTVITICSALNYGSTLVVPAPLYDPGKALDAIRDEKLAPFRLNNTFYRFGFFVDAR